MGPNILQSAAILLEEDQWLDELAGQWLDQGSQWAGYKVGLNRVALSTEPRALRNRVIRRAIHRVKGDLRKVGALHVEEVADLFLRPQVGKRISLPDDMEAQCDREHVWIYKIQDFKKWEMENPSLPEILE